MRTNILTIAAVVASLSGAGIAAAQTPDSTQYQAPMAGTYDFQQPMAGSYQMQQPMTGSYQMQQPLTGTYQLQQPMTGSYGLQQPMTGSYTLQQPLSGSSLGQQPLTGSFNAQGNFNSQGSFNSQQPMTGTGGSGFQTTLPSNSGALPSTGTTTTLPGSSPVQQPNVAPLPSTQPGGSTTGVR